MADPVADLEARIWQVAQLDRVPADELFVDDLIHEVLQWLEAIDPALAVRCRREVLERANAMRRPRPVPRA